VVAGALVPWIVSKGRLASALMAVGYLDMNPRTAVRAAALDKEEKISGTGT